MQANAEGKMEQGAKDAVDAGGGTSVKGDLYSVHNFDINIELKVPTGKGLDFPFDTLDRSKIASLTVAFAFAEPLYNGIM